MTALYHHWHLLQTTPRIPNDQSIEETHTIYFNTSIHCRIHALTLEFGSLLTISLFGIKKAIGVGSSVDPDTVSLIVASVTLPLSATLMYCNGSVGGTGEAGGTAGVNVALLTEYSCSPPDCTSSITSLPS